MKRLVALQRYRAFGRGTINSQPDNRKILAFVRREAGEAIRSSPASRFRNRSS
jgi:hypothetical protein